MRVLQTTQADATAADAAVERLHAAVTRLRARRGADERFEGFESALHEVFMQAEREVLAEELARLDVNRPQVLIDGHLYHRALRSSETYTSAAGPVTVWRTLYRRGRETVAVSLDGVMTPMKDGTRSAKREAAMADGKRTKGPAG